METKLEIKKLRIKDEFKGLVISKRVVFSPASTLTLTLDTNNVTESKYSHYNKYFEDVFEEYIEEVETTDTIVKINTSDNETRQIKKRRARRSKTSQQTES